MLTNKAKHFSARNNMKILTTLSRLFTYKANLCPVYGTVYLRGPRYIIDMIPAVLGVPHHTYSEGTHLTYCFIVLCSLEHYEGGGETSAFPPVPFFLVETALGGC